MREGLPGDGNELPLLAGDVPADHEGGRVALLELGDRVRIPARLVHLHVDPVRRRVRVDAGIFVDELPADLEAHAVVRGDVEAVDARLLEEDVAGDERADTGVVLARQHAPAAHAPVEMGDGRPGFELPALHLVDVVHDRVRVLDGETGSQSVRRGLGLDGLEAAEGPGPRRHRDAHEADGDGTGDTLPGSCGHARSFVSGPAWRQGLGVGDRRVRAEMVGQAARATQASGEGYAWYP